jgi:transcriptional regulator with XRE-family HTH domain
MPTATPPSSSPGPRLAVPGSEKLGLRVQARRRELGYRFAKDFAEAMGWNPSMVSRLEAGERGLYQRDVEQLCRHLNVTPDWFTGGREQLIPATDETFASMVEDLLALRRQEVVVLERMADLLRRRGG